MTFRSPSRSPVRSPVRTPVRTPPAAPRITREQRATGLARRRLGFDEDIPAFNLNGNVPQRNIRPLLEDQSLASAKFSPFVSKECTICYDTLDVSDSNNPVCEITNCHHAFHCGCLNSFRMTGYDTCPICRQRIENVVQKSPSAEFTRMDFGKKRKIKINLRSVNLDIKYLKT